MLFDFSVVLPNPPLDLMTLVPGGPVPQNQQHALGFRFGLLQQGIEEGNGLVTVGLTVGEDEKALLASDGPVTGKRLVDFILRWQALHQFEVLTGSGKGVHSWLSKAAKPTLVLFNQQPIGLLSG